jgi:hypothetical protein
VIGKVVPVLWSSDGHPVPVLWSSLDFKPGDPAPTGYIAWHEWAAAQHEGGLRQRRCPGCGRWRFPQEECCGPGSGRKGG